MERSNPGPKVLPAALAFAETIGIGIARFYACIILFNLMMWLPFYLIISYRFGIPLIAVYEEKYYYIFDILLNFASFLRGIDGLYSPASLPDLWQVLVVPGLLMIAGVLAIRKHRFQIEGASLLLLSSCCLASLIGGLMFRGFLNLSRSFLLIGLILLVPATAFWAFRRLFISSTGSWVVRLASFASTFLVPSAIVTFFTVMQLSKREGPLWDSDLILFEGWLWIYWPVVSVAALGVLSTTVKWRPQPN